MERLDMVDLVNRETSKLGALVQMLSECRELEDRAIDGLIFIISEAEERIKHAVNAYHEQNK